MKESSLLASFGEVSMCLVDILTEKYLRIYIKRIWSKKLNVKLMGYQKIKDIKIQRKK